MKVTILASGSGGNATLVEEKDTKILLDCGISYRQIQSRLEQRSLSIENLDAILVTHEHTDHVKGVDVTLKRQQQAKCYLTEDTHNGMYFKVKENLSTNQLSYIQHYEEFQVKDITILPIPISHDAKDTVGYILSSDSKKLVYITDVGYLPVRDHEILRNADMYIFESNYDVTMLFTSKRPFYLKQRIDSVKGHMSNNDSAYNLSQLVGERTKQIVLAHRSKECNTDEHVLTTYKEVFTDYGLDVNKYNLVVAHQDIPTETFHF